MARREVCRKSYTGSVDGSHMTGCIGDVQLDEEGAALLGVVGQQGCDGVTDTTTHLVPHTVALGRLREA